MCELATEFAIHPGTAAEHLQRRDVPRTARRKLSNVDVNDAAHRYQAGDSLATIAKALNVHATTIRCELQLAGIKIRPRRGWRLDPARSSATPAPHRPRQRSS